MFVCIESPYKPALYYRDAPSYTSMRPIDWIPSGASIKLGVEEHALYARMCLKNSISLGEAPLAGHLLYTQVLNDSIPAERNVGIGLHCRCLAKCDMVAVYCDLGQSSGMLEAISLALDLGVSVGLRRLWDLDEYDVAEKLLSIRGAL